MDIPIYHWKAGIPTKLPADTFVTHLRAMKEQLGRDPTPEDLVRDSAPPSSVLHDEFRWHDPAEVFANDWRIHHAQQLLNGIVVQVEITEPVKSSLQNQVIIEPLTTPAAMTVERRLIVSFRKPEASGRRQFRDRELVLSTTEDRSLLLSQLRRDCLSFAKNYFEKYGSDLPEVQDITESVYELYRRTVAHGELDRD